MDMQVIEFQFFINLFSMSIGIVDIIFAGIQCHQWNTIIQRETLFVSQLYKNQKNISPRLYYSHKNRSIYNPDKTYITIYDSLHKHTRRIQPENYYLYWIHHNSYITPTICVKVLFWQQIISL